MLQYRYLIVLLSIVISSPVQADELIPDFTAYYTVQYNGLAAAELVQSLTSQNKGTRKFTAVRQATGLYQFIKPDIIEEQSIWKLNNESISPLHYHYQKTGGTKEKWLSMDFDWSKNIVKIDDKQHPWELPITIGVMDKLVYQLSLMRDLSKITGTIDYQIADGGKLKLYKIAVVGKETIETPLGKFDTIKLTRIKTQKNTRKTILWCAPELNNLPVKLVHTEKDGQVTALINRLTGITVPNTDIQATTTTPNG